eukprot:scaffold88449_cov30-Tisochrysis_lutea.AAC.5
MWPLERQWHALQSLRFLGFRGDVRLSFPAPVVFKGAGGVSARAARQDVLYRKTRRAGHEHQQARRGFCVREKATTGRSSWVRRPMVWFGVANPPARRHGRFATAPRFLKGAIEIWP